MIEFYFKAGFILVVYFLIGAVGIQLYLIKKGAERKKELWTKYFVYLGLVTILHSTFSYASPTVTMVVLLTILAKGVMETRTIWTLSKKEWWLFILFIVMVGFGTILSISFILVPFLYVLVVVFDGFSQIVGQLFGKIKLFPKISPNKTVEGFIGGSVSVFITSTILIDKGISPVTASVTGSIFFSILVIIPSITGDWLASWLKRKNGVKDYSKLIPGHGGIFDRFDAFFFVLFVAGIVVIPLVWIILTLFNSQYSN